MIRAIMARLGYSFRGLSLTAQLVTAVVVLWLLAVVIGRLGFDAVSREVGVVAVTLGSLVVTGLVIRHLFTHYRSSYRRRT